MNTAGATNIFRIANEINDQLLGEGQSKEAGSDYVGDRLHFLNRLFSHTGWKLMAVVKQSVENHDRDVIVSVVAQPT